MMKFKPQAWSGILAISTIALSRPALAEPINLRLLQLNDIYEITPIEGGTRGGLARVATLRQQLLKENPRTYTILAGDSFSPSALGTAQVDGKPIAGQQMIAVMNALGFNYATFSNHEFDLGNDFLMSGRESGLDFLTLQQPGVKLVSEKRDIRLVVIDQLKADRTSEKVLAPTR